MVCRLVGLTETGCSGRTRWVEEEKLLISVGVTIKTTRPDTRLPYFLSGFLFRVRGRVRVKVGVGGGFRVRVRVRASVRAR